MKQWGVSISTDLLSDQPPINAVGAVVYRYTKREQLEILLIKKRGGFWTLPKGQTEPGEDNTAAVVREVREETGISGALEADIAQVRYVIIKRGEPRIKQVSYYLVRACKGRLRPDKKEQIERVKWFPLPAALRRIKRGRVRAMARQAGEILRAPDEPRNDQPQAEPSARK